MNYYNRCSSQDLKTLKDLNDKIIAEEKKNSPDNKQILRLKQQLLMKGMEISVNFNPLNHNTYF